MTLFPDDTRLFVRRVLITISIATLFTVLIVLSWHIAEVLLVIFGAILFAVLLDGLAHLLRTAIPLPRGLSLLIVIMLLIFILVGVFVLGSPRIGQQIAQLNERFPKDVNHIKEVLSQHFWGRVVLENVPQPHELVSTLSDELGRLGGAFSTALGVIINSFIIIVTGLYLAANPGIYTGSVVRLFPMSGRNQISQVIQALGHVLRWWLIGRIATMTAMGAMTTLALWIMDMPLPLALGFIVGLLTFIPYVGAIVSAVPAVLVALVEGPWQAVYVIIVYTFVHIFEGYLITPIIQRRAVSLPPAVLLTGQLVMGVLFGLLGILLATPLIIVIIVIVQMVYIEGVLNDSVSLLGEHKTT